MYCVLYFTLEKKNISDWPKSGPVETGPTGLVATPLLQRYSTIDKPKPRVSVLTLELDRRVDSAKG